MKKGFLLLTALSLCLCAAAQDTIHTRNLPQNYLSNTWPLADDKEMDVKIFIHTQLPHSEAMYCAKKVSSSDTVKVYGIAVALEPANDEGRWWSYGDGVYDTCLDNTYEYFSLYSAPAGDTMRCVSDSLLIHLRDTPVAYRIDLDYVDNYHRRLPTLEFHEAYFEHPYQMGGDFYIARTFRSISWPFVDSGTGISYDSKYFMVSMNGLRFSWPNNPGIPIEGTADSMFYRNHWDSVQIDPYSLDWTYDTVIWLPEMEYHWLLYPILTPSSGGGDDTTGIGHVPAVNRFVSIGPNPATGLVKIMSSCGMSQVTVYNPQGEPVHRQQASGITASLNVEGWPSGCYIVHVETPLGCAVKKMIIGK